MICIQSVICTALINSNPDPKYKLNSGYDIDIRTLNFDLKSIFDGFRMIGTRKND